MDLELISLQIEYWENLLGPVAAGRSRLNPVRPGHGLQANNGQVLLFQLFYPLLASAIDHYGPHLFSLWMMIKDSKGEGV